ncbi:filament-like plant protein 3 [Zingiber officinale]|uniref:Filament-like plant protein n=1 Tax=Zingiber officinale TaxID=94328 RepID=A0A8J5H5X6_ZINOF|nr:filament-like plant protein 3 [Zingiber officinale]XP_042385604.1 filament-like plant protein 3 [Zingiber officinale]XP_042385605.1 filament-like plant protein 3 [Zingiber officinale]XP_042385606.1 filament-like plant protein 3 [Zingiber officinale]XP_042385607.1 filament-like plant protein 3 [Zingiber officinale]KAG6512944.1 hypothetical protein ZIOFF_031083 [Zingiber officinale]
MDRRSWIWRRKSSEKEGGCETESSGSVSSERYSGEQEATRTSSIGSPKHAQLPEVSSKDVDHEVDETTKILNDKLSAALLNISAKEELVKQHAEVAEEAVLGWENAEKEVSILRQQHEDALKKSSSLEDKATHLNAALKECVRQLRLTREEQEQKVQDAILRKTHEWKSEKSELELQLIELQAQMEAKIETSTSFEYDLCSEIEDLKKENSVLKADLATLTENLHMRTLELELITRTAETSSKQHLDSIKKLARLEAECHKLRAAAHKLSSANKHKFISTSQYVESVTDSQSDAGERQLSLDHEQSGSDSCASALISELDQFNKEKDSPRSLNTAVEIGLMDDFLEMERLVALPEVDHGSYSPDNDADSDRTVTRQHSSRNELEAVHLHITELEETIEKMKSEKVEMERSLAVTNNQLKDTCMQLTAAEGKIVVLQRQLNLTNGEKHVLELELEAAEGKKNELELQLELAHTENHNLCERITSLDKNFDEEKKLSSKLRVRCQNMEATEAKRNEMQLQLESAFAEIIELRGKVRLLEEVVEEEKKLSTELASRCSKIDVLKQKKEELEWELESTNLELCKLHEKVGLIERKLKEEKAFSAGLLIKYETTELTNVRDKELEHQLSSKDLELVMLQEKVNILEDNVEKERAKRSELVLQLELAHKEVGNLHEKLGTLEKQMEDENAAESRDHASKYHILENQLQIKQQATKFYSSATCNEKPIVRQDKVIVPDVEKLAECQKTIASLNHQLKLLSNFDEFMLETDKPESPNGEFSASLPNTEQTGNLKMSTSLAGQPEFSCPSRKDCVTEIL